MKEYRIRKGSFVGALMAIAMLTLFSSCQDFLIQAPGAEAAVSRAVMPDSAFLKADGMVLRNNWGTGSIVNLRGTNLGGWLLQEAWMSPLKMDQAQPDEWKLRQILTARFGESVKESLISGYQDNWIKASDLDNIKNLGFNFVRVPILYLQLMDMYGNWKSDPWSKLDWLVSECAARGIYVLLDLHGTFGGQNMWDNCGEQNTDPQFWKNTVYQDRTVALWEGIARHYKGNPTIAGYDLLNEPDLLSGDAAARAKLNSIFNRLYQAVRAIDPDHIVCFEALYGLWMLEPPSTYGWTNVLYQTHFYAMDKTKQESTNWDVQNNMVTNVLNDVRRYQTEWNVPVYAGEYCIFQFPDLWRKLLAGFNSMNISWSSWTYKVTSQATDLTGNLPNWGLYYNNQNPYPNVSTESAADIAAKWTKFSTNHFQANTGLQDIVRAYSGQAPAPLPTRIALKAAANGKFVCAADQGKSQLVADRDQANDWERFLLFRNWDGSISLRSLANGQFVTADLNANAKLIARGPGIQQWEKFTRVDMGNGSFGLKALANGKFVCADLNAGALLSANRSDIGGAWEVFSEVAQ